MVQSTESTEPQVTVKKKVSSKVVDRSTRQTYNVSDENNISPPNKKPVPVKKKTYPGGL